MALRNHICALLICASFPASAPADFEQGLSAYKSGDYRAASAEFRPLAEAGQADAQYYLARMYYEGRGVPKSYREAAIWFRRAAEQGQAGAMNFMGILYHLGHGVARDPEEATRWYRLAAENGSEEAKFNLGGMYEAGTGTTRNYVQSYKWYLLASSGALPEEQRQQVIQALAKIGQRMTPDQIEEARQLAQEWNTTVANEEQ